MQMRRIMPFAHEISVKNLRQFNEGTCDRLVTQLTHNVPL